MTFQALLVSKDEEAAAILDTVLAGFGVASTCCGYPEALCKVTEQKFDAVVVDFDDPHSAALVFENVQQSPGTVTVALLGDKAKVRNVFGQGANFILYKPFSREQAEASLRAATALIKRERRSSCRISVQVPIQLKREDSPDIEGILLDLSETGMDVLAAQPLRPSAPISAQFMLPDGKTQIEVHGETAWANENGESGVKFVNLPESVRKTLKSWITANASEPPPPDAEPVKNCKLTDLSLGGCYIETESPFPERSGITLCLKSDNVEVQLDGTVRVMHPEYGMGVEFASRTGDERAQVEKFIEFLSSKPGTMPVLEITPRTLTAADSSSGAAGESSGDDLLDLLHRHESLSQEEFLEELRLQRSQEVTSA